MTNLTVRALTFAAAGLSLTLAQPACGWAHHSFSAFDRREDAIRTISGTVTEFDFMNPHGWLKLLVADGENKTSSWSFEMSSATQIGKLGWSTAAIKPGDRVTVAYFPLRFGGYGGQLVSVKLPDGRELKALAEPDRGYPGT